MYIKERDTAKPMARFHFWRLTLLKVGVFFYWLGMQACGIWFKNGLFSSICFQEKRRKRVLPFFSFLGGIDLAGLVETSWERIREWRLVGVLLSVSHIDFFWFTNIIPKYRHICKMMLYWKSPFKFDIHIDLIRL